MLMRLFEWGEEAAYYPKTEKKEKNNGPNGMEIKKIAYLCTDITTKLLQTILIRAL